MIWIILMVLAVFLSIYGIFVSIHGAPWQNNRKDEFQSAVGRLLIKESGNDMQIINPVREITWLPPHVSISLILFAFSVMFIIFLPIPVHGFVNLDKSNLTVFLVSLCYIIVFLSFFKHIVFFICGDEIITISQDKLRIEYLSMKWKKVNEYDLSVAKNFRVYLSFSTTVSLFTKGRIGLSAFDYNGKVIKFARGIDRNEAIYIMNKLKEKNCMQEYKTFSPSLLGWSEK